MLPAEKTHYRRGLTLGLTLAEVFTIIVFILLITCTVLLRSVGQERDEAERERDKAETDLTLARDMLRGEESWLDADAWYSEVRRLRLELEEARIHIESVQTSLREAQAAEEEARRLLIEEVAAAPPGDLESTSTPDEIAERVMEQASSIATQTDSIARLNEVLGQEMKRADSIAQEAKSLERFARTVRAALDSMASSARDSASGPARLPQPAPGAPSERDSRATGDEPDTDREPEIVRELESERTRIASRVAADDALSAAVAEIAEAAEVASLREQLEDQSRANRALRERVEEYKQLDSWDARDSLSRTAAELEVIRRQTATITRERDQAVELVEYYRAAELRRLGDGSGIDAPPCWFDSARRRLEYIFRIELTEGGFRVFNIAPPRRNSDPALRHADQIEFEYGREYAPEGFRRLAGPIYDLGVADTATFGPQGCRYYVEAVDLTGTDKSVFQERLRQLERYFFKRMIWR